jgi:hypothetical protein
MAKRVIAGILGAIVGVLPLALVNVVVNGGGTFGDVETQAVDHAVAVGAVALLGGVALGGTVAGWIGGRRGGAAGGGISGAVAAILYAIVVILAAVGGARQGWAPPIFALHPIRTSAAVVLVATLLLAVALVVGRLAGARPAPGARAPVSGAAGAGRLDAAGPRPVGAPPADPRAQGFNRPIPPSRPPAGAPARSSFDRSAPRPRR